MSVGTGGRSFAAGIAASAWTGLIVQFVITLSQASFSMTLWVLSGYFTILTNLIVAAVFTAIAARRHSLLSDSLLAGTTLCILLVGVIYSLLLHGTMELSGGSAVANSLLHWVTPSLALLFWMFFAVKGRLSWRDPLLWAIYPLVYLAYALVRGAATGRYAYPFLDIATLGWPRTAVNLSCIAAGFLLSGFALVLIDGRIGHRFVPRRA